MSFREKTAWIAVLAYALVFGGYFYSLWCSWDTAFGAGLSLGLMAGAVVMLVVITVGLTIVAALLNPKEANAPADEREKLIELKAERIGAYTLSALLVCLIAALLLGWDGVLVANLLLAAMVIAEVAKAVAQIAYYRAGA